MPRVISNACLACGACVSECPVDAISEGEIMVVDQSTCIDCGACDAVCPVNAISEE